MNNKQQKNVGGDFSENKPPWRAQGLSEDFASRYEAADDELKRKESADSSNSTSSGLSTSSSPSANSELGMAYDYYPPPPPVFDFMTSPVDNFLNNYVQKIKPSKSKSVRVTELMVSEPTLEKPKRFLDEERLSSCSSSSSSEITNSIVRGMIIMSGDTHPVHEATGCQNLKFTFRRDFELPRMKQEGLIVARYPFVLPGWYQIRGFNDVDKNMASLRNLIESNCFGSLKFEFKKVTVDMPTFEIIVDAIMAKKGLLPFFDAADFT